MSTRLESHWEVAVSCQRDGGKVDLRGQSHFGLLGVQVREESVVLVVGELDALDDGYNAYSDTSRNIRIAVGCIATASGTNIRNGRVSEGSR